MMAESNLLENTFVLLADFIRDNQYCQREASSSVSESESVSQAFEPYELEAAGAH